ncbi:MAG: patatin-like phospholipase family protein [Sphaerochaetaceae bacterium]
MEKKPSLMLSSGIVLAVLLCLACLFPLPAAEVRTLQVGETTVSLVSYGLNEAQKNATPKVALVLSGGGARGFAHIPVIEAIERLGIPVDMVLGTSMGSLIGGLYAAGYSPGDIRRLIAEHNMLSLFMVASVKRPQPVPEPLRKSRDNLFNVMFDEKGLGNSSGLIGDQEILTILNDSLSRVAAITDFDKLAIPFRCIGTDAVTGEKIVFSSGSLVSAIRGSISIPVVFPIYPIGDRFVVDGGLVDNMPIDLARELGADIVIAVDVNASDYAITAEDLTSITSVLVHMLAVITKNTVIEQAKHADVLITPDLSEHGILDFLSIGPIIEQGAIAAADKQEALRSIADRIGESRVLEVRDPDRYGPYFSLPDVYIASVSHLSVFGSPTGDVDFNLKPFMEFAGLPLDNNRKEELRRMFEDIRSEGYFATISYDFNQTRSGKSDTVLGNLEIQTRSFPQKAASFGMGAFGSISYSGDNPYSSALGFQFHPAFSFTLALERLPGSTSNYGLETSLSYDDALHINVKTIGPLSEWATLSMALGYSAGALHPSNLSGSPESIKEVDSEITTDVATSFWFLKNGRASIHFELDGIRFGDYVDVDVDPALPLFSVIPGIRLEAVWTNLPFGFFPEKGIRAEFEAFVNLNPEEVVYRLEGRFQQALPVGERYSFWYDLHAGSSRSPFPLKKNYFEYGGSQGMGGYGPYSLVDDMVLARLGLLQSVGKKARSLYICYTVMIGASSQTTYSILHDGGSLMDESAPFSGLGELEGGVSVGFGFPSEFGDFLVGASVGTTGRFSFFVEFI